MSRSEFALLEAIRKILPPPSQRVQVGIGDDGCVLAPSCSSQVISVDMMVENVHFDFAFCTPFDVGFKALQVNLSDLAAMGAHPETALVSLAIPKTMSDERVLEFYQGLAHVAQNFSVDVVGGNLSSSPQGFIADVTVLGSCDPAVLRSGLQEGDYLAVTGPLGASALGLLALQTKGIESRSWAPYSTDRYLRPQARVDTAQKLVRSGCVHAMIDISDGLSSECQHLAQASRKSMTLFAETLPPPPDLSQARQQLEVDPTNLICHGGGDYELLVGLDSRRWEDAVMNDLSLRDLVHIIGEVQSDSTNGEVWLESREKREYLKPRGWDHFA